MIEKIKQIEDRVKALWIKQLYLEYEHICRKYRVKMQGVVISLHEHPVTLGSFDIQTRIISLSTQLLKTQSWDIVLEVLKHEMAHQYTAEILAKKDEQHGVFFKKACVILGVESWAQKAQLSFSDICKAHDSVLSAEQEALLRKVKKLLNLAQSENSHEAELAIMRAQEICSRHALAEIEKLQASDFVSVYINHGKKRIESFQVFIGDILISYFHVKVIYTSLYNAQNLQENKVIEVIGLRKDALIAEYIYWFLHNQMMMSWREYATRTGKRSLTEKNAFAQGFLAGVKKNLQLKNKSSINKKHTHQGLVPIFDKKLTSYVDFRYPDLSHRVIKASSKDRQSFGAGHICGENLELRKSVNNEKIFSIEGRV